MPDPISPQPRTPTFLVSIRCLHRRNLSSCNKTLLDEGIQSHEQKNRAKTYGHTYHRPSEKITIQHRPAHNPNGEEESPANLIQNQRSSLHTCTPAKCAPNSVPRRPQRL